MIEQVVSPTREQFHPTPTPLRSMRAVSSTNDSVGPSILAFEIALSECGASETWELDCAAMLNVESSGCAGGGRAALSHYIGAIIPDRSL